MTIKELVALALAEDLGDGDHTSLATVPYEASGEAIMYAKQDGVLSGMNVAKEVFNQVDAELDVDILMQDGSKITFGDKVMVVKGRSQSILSAERTALNFVQRMSGIASFTNEVVGKIEGLHTKLLDTRKTTPVNRLVEKMAVKTGGGYNHRFGLYDMIMIKDNHVDFAGGIEKAINATHNYLKDNSKELKIELEVRNFEELDEALNIGGIHRIMLDNFTPDELRKALKIINGKYETEASGGITLDSIRDYAETGVDFISVGALTHQIKSLDLSLKANFNS
ncbi:MAG: nicotinate-nucleotide diphosphorylase (carboxylating) [Marinilabiliales bacterium]|nr:MAG: nicotinate-nucleotide diphosphorylase (carboxylating) [Marinilabiliales bacterium]